MNPNDNPQKMVFDGEDFQRGAQSFQTTPPKIIGWVIKYSRGLIKDEKQANYVLLTFVVVAMAISFYLFFSGGSGPTVTPIQPAR